MTANGDDLNALRSSVTALFQREAGPATLRGLWDSETGRSPALWKGLVDIGITEMLLEDDVSRDEEMYVVLEEVGRHCVPDALLEGVYLAVPAIGSSRARSLTEPWLQKLINGSARATTLLSGSPYVADAHLADVLLVEVEDSFHLLTRDEFIATPVATMDPSRRLSKVVAHASEATNLQLAPDMIESIRQRALIGTAAMLNGVAHTLIHRTLDYVKERDQFGRKIGSFQAIKHLLADTFSWVTLARLAGQAAASDLAKDATNATNACLAARVVATEAEERANDVALQCHGGIGFTWEHDLQMWLKRGKALEFTHGTPADLTCELGARRVGSRQQ